MIKKISADPDTSKITEIDYNNNSFEKTIETKILTTSNQNDPKNVGTILEKFRGLTLDAKKYFEDNKPILDKFINRYPLTFDNFTPDCIICFFPSDNNRKELLKTFRNKVTLNYENRDDIDYSDKFVKIDPNKSIKKDSLTKDDFILSLDLETPIRALLIIDDVIDEGKTLNILLDKLVEKKIITNETVIKVACIYNRPKKTRTY